MIDSWRSREFDCDGGKWVAVRHVRAEANASAATGSSSTKQTGLYFHNDGTVRLLAFTHSALPSESDIRSMSEEALCALLRRAVSFR